MMTALTKVDTPLMERYTTTCVRCQWVRQFFGTATEARKSAETMGWEFRSQFMQVQQAPLGPQAPFHEIFGVTKIGVEVAFCPHCAILTKDPA